MTRLVALLHSQVRRVVPVGYSRSDLYIDLSAGLTVSVVALPLGLVVAIAAGASPDKGLVGIIIGGAVIALFTASRFQIGGPTEACILIAVVVIELFGYEGLLAATLLSGIFLLAMAITRVGILIEAMPQAVITGFVTGMGLIIFTGQIVPFLGLAGTVHAHEHGGGEHSHSFLFIIEGVVSRLDAFDLTTFAIGGLSLLGVVLTKRYLPKLPSYVMGLNGGRARHLSPEASGGHHREYVRRSAEPAALAGHPLAGHLGDAAALCGRHRLPVERRIPARRLDGEPFPRRAQPPQPGVHRPRPWEHRDGDLGRLPGGRLRGPHRDLPGRRGAVPRWPVCFTPFSWRSSSSSSPGLSSSSR